jgi:hypothetical protein
VRDLHQGDGGYVRIDFVGGMIPTRFYVDSENLEGGSEALEPDGIMHSQSNVSSSTTFGSLTSTKQTEESIRAHAVRTESTAYND